MSKNSLVEEGEIADLLQRIKQYRSQRRATALDRFLHPLTGGRDGRGWTFGRVPRTSDLVGEMTRVPGVAHVLEPRVEYVPLGTRAPAGSRIVGSLGNGGPPPEVRAWLARSLAFSGEHVITLPVTGEERR